MAPSATIRRPTRSSGCSVSGTTAARATTRRTARTASRSAPTRMTTGPTPSSTRARRSTGIPRWLRAPSGWAGVMHYVNIDVANLNKWLRGAAPYAAGSGTLALANYDKGYSIYFSDRRNNRADGLNGTTNNAETGEYGYEDVVNPLAADGAPSGDAGDRRGHQRQRLSRRLRQVSQLPRRAEQPAAAAGGIDAHGGEHPAGGGGWTVWRDDQPGLPVPAGPRALEGNARQLHRARRQGPHDRDGEPGVRLRRLELERRRPP